MPDRIATVVTILSEILCVEPEEIVPAALLREDLKADSIDFVEITVMIEDKLAILIEDDEVAPLIKVQDVFDLVERKAAA